MNPERTPVLVSDDTDGPKFDQSMFRTRLLLLRESRDTGQILALQQLERGSSASRHVRELVLCLVVGDNGSRVTTACARQAPKQR